MGLRQQIMDKEVKTLEETALSRRTEEDLHTQESRDKEGEMFTSGGMHYKVLDSTIIGSI